MPRPFYAALFWLATAVLLAPSCGDDDGEPGASTPAATASEEPASITPSPTEGPFSGGRDPATATPRPAFVSALLRDIRTAEQDGFDRITFEFTFAIPGFDVRYVELPIVYDPRGDEMDIQGAAFIVVRMEPGASYDPTTGDPTYLGPLELKPALPSLLESERVGDFEGVLSWALGLRAEADFRVTTLEDPPRLVVDIAHP
jgi:hypothetical protein